jgi:hypothetical protein
MLAAVLTGVLALGTLGVPRPVPPALAGEDVFGQRLALRVPAGEPVLLILASPHSGGGLTRSGPEMYWRLRDVRFHTVVQVDLRGVPRLFVPVARSRLRKAWDDTVKSYEEAFRRHGDAPPPHVADSLTIEADPDGEHATRAGLAAGWDGYVAVVLDGQGREVARGTLPADAARLEEALRGAGAPAGPGGGR